MKKIGYLTLLALLLGAALPLTAQNLTLGERTSEIKIEQYLRGSELQKDTPLYIEFFNSLSRPSWSRLPDLIKLSNTAGESLQVLVLSNQTQEAMEQALKHKALNKKHALIFAIDPRNRNFDAYGVYYVPFGVLLDRKGKLLWFGNSSRISNEELLLLLQ